MTDPARGVNYNLPGNSNKAKQDSEPEVVRVPKLKKVTTGEVVQRKPSLGKRIKATFTGDDSRTVGNYVLFEVMLPAAKQMIVESISQGVERMFYGESTRRPSSGGRPGYTAYNRVSPQSTGNPVRSISPQARATHDFREILYSSRGEAEKVSTDLLGAIEQYGIVSLADLYDAVGITGNFQDDKWGWYEMTDVRIRRVKDGYLLDLPRPQPIE